ncbi:MAG: hypothetical protein IJK85_06610 [Bacteroidales bacterium]|nr:hypothetical protein [Bacteroidales bacterium]
MKKAVYILSAFTFIYLDLALLFKILHWPGGNILLLLTCLIIIPVTVILATICLCKEDNKSRNQE